MDMLKTAISMMKPGSEEWSSQLFSNLCNSHDEIRLLHGYGGPERRLLHGPCWLLSPNKNIWSPVLKESIFSTLVFPTVWLVLPVFLLMDDVTSMNLVGSRMALTHSILRAS